ncbi:MAG: hypothetical protein WCJ61_08200 [Paludibacter sp.]
MIQLFVNANELFLPLDFSITLIEENPIITANGEFTLDISLSLLEPMNARAFGFLNRINKYFAPDYKKDAPAYMIIDGAARYGKIIVLSNTDIEVTFQFIAGNSALNYDLRKDDRKIWELDWGTIPIAITYTVALDSIKRNGYCVYMIPPTTMPHYNNFVCAPIYSNDGTNPLIINNYTLGGQTDTDPYAINGGSKFIAQPYLLYYINKIADVLGFSLGLNVLDTDERAKKMYVVNSIDSLIYADMLPDMTIAKFIETIENFFNVVFIIDKTTNSMSIQNMMGNLATRNKVDLLNVLDSYQRDLATTPKAERIGTTKISYSVPDSTYMKFQKVDIELMKLCQIIEHVNFAALVAFLGHTDGMGDKLIIHRDVETLRDYFIRAYRDGIDIKCDLYDKQITWSVDGRTGGFGIVYINKFRSYGENYENELTLDIVPAAITIDSRYLTKLFDKGINQTGASVGRSFIYQLPISSRNYYKYESMGFIESVTNSDKKIPRLSNFEVALYTGMINICGDFSRDYYLQVSNFPFSHVDTIPEFGQQINPDWLSTAFNPAATTTMRLLGTKGIVEDYSFESVMDTSKEYTFTLIDSPEVNINNLFNINNKMFMPISLERVISINSRKTVTGRFYAMLQAQ